MLCPSESLSAGHVNVDPSRQMNWVVTGILVIGT